MIEDMSVRDFNEKTRNDYIRQVRTFTAFLRRSPDTATPEDLRRYQLHQTQTGVRPRASTPPCQRFVSSSP
jgi:integrase/recombinase XerD